ncbi:MAG: hypothetical protein ACNA77_11590, partial [Opitutales bacterium]
MHILFIILIAAASFFAWQFGWFSDEPEIAAENTKAAVVKVVDTAENSVTRKSQNFRLLATARLKDCNSLEWAAFIG